MLNKKVVRKQDMTKKVKMIKAQTNCKIYKNLTSNFTKEKISIGKWVFIMHYFQQKYQKRYCQE